MDWTNPGRAVERIDTFTEKVDAVIERVGTKYVDRVREAAQEKARSDAEYARIEKARAGEQGTIILFDPKGADLGWDEWEYQMDVERAYTRETWRLYAARWASGRPLRRAFNNYVARQQRKQRGWDFRAIYSLDHHLSSTLGPQLLQLADEIARKRDASWVEEMRAAGNALVAYSQKDDGKYDGGVNPVEFQKREEEIANEAKQAIRWVADNLTRLWD